MTKDDYMRLPKERLAELLEMHDNQIELANSMHVIPTPDCFHGGPCTNPHFDCINCPRRFMTGGVTIGNIENYGKEEK